MEKEYSCKAEHYILPTLFLSYLPTKNQNYLENMQQWKLLFSYTKIPQLDGLYEMCILNLLFSKNIYIPRNEEFICEISRK